MIITLIVTIVVSGWLFFSPPSADTESSGVVSCVALGAGSFVPESADSKSGSLDEDETPPPYPDQRRALIAIQEHLEIDSGCQQARANRQAELMLAIGLGLAALLIVGFSDSRTAAPKGDSGLNRQRISSDDMKRGA